MNKITIEQKREDVTKFVEKLNGVLIKHCPNKYKNQFDGKIDASEFEVSDILVEELYEFMNSYKILNRMVLYYPDVAFGERINNEFGKNVLYIEDVLEIIKGNENLIYTISTFNFDKQRVIRTTPGLNLLLLLKSYYEDHANSRNTFSHDSLMILDKFMEKFDSEFKEFDKKRLNYNMNVFDSAPCPPSIQKFIKGFTLSTVKPDVNTEELKTITESTILKELRSYIWTLITTGDTDGFLLNLASLENYMLTGNRTVKLNISIEDRVVSLESPCINDSIRNNVKTLRAKEQYLKITDGNSVLIPKPERVNEGHSYEMGTDNSSLSSVLGECVSEATWTGERDVVKKVINTPIGEIQSNKVSNEKAEAAYKECVKSEMEEVVEQYCEIEEDDDATVESDDAMLMEIENDLEDMDKELLDVTKAKPIEPCGDIKTQLEIHEIRQELLRMNNMLSILSNVIGNLDKRK